MSMKIPQYEHEKLMGFQEYRNENCYTLTKNLFYDGMTNDNYTFSIIYKILVIEMLEQAKILIAEFYLWRSVAIGFI